MPNAASAIVTAAEPIRATLATRASIGGCRAANRNPPPRRHSRDRRRHRSGGRQDRQLGRPAFTRRRTRALASGTTFAAPHSSPEGIAESGRALLVATCGSGHAVDGYLRSRRLPSRSACAEGGRCIVFGEVSWTRT
jgi:hypothetical protein